MELKAKEFDIVNLKRYDTSRAENLLGKEAVNNTWDRLVNIKSQGFSSWMISNINCI